MTIRRITNIRKGDASLRRSYRVLDEALVVETNDQRVLHAADTAFLRSGPPPGTADPLVIRVLTETDADPLRGAEFRARVSHRIQGGWYFVSAAEDVAFVDADGGRGVAFLSDASAQDERFVRYSFLEGMALAMTSRGRGYIPLHASGVALDGAGLALVGPEGSGKSTLSVAAARRGMSVFAEDSVFARSGPAGLEFWGMPWVQRLLVDSISFFPEFESIEPVRQPNGEVKIEIDLDERCPGAAVTHAQPAGLVVLDPRQPGLPRLTRVDSSETQVDVTWPWGDTWTERHAEADRLLTLLPAYRLVPGDEPSETVDLLAQLLRDLAPAPSAR